MVSLVRKGFNSIKPQHNDNRLTRAQMLPQQEHVWLISHVQGLCYSFDSVALLADPPLPLCTATGLCGCRAAGIAGSQQLLLWMRSSCGT